MLSKVVCIVEVDEAVLVSLYNNLREKNSSGNILGNLTCHIVALYAVYGRILVCVLLLYLLVVTLDKRHNLIVGGIRLTDKLSLISISNVSFGKIKCAKLHNFLFNKVLYLLDSCRANHGEAKSLYLKSYIFNIRSGYSLIFINCFVRTSNSYGYFLSVEDNL